MRQTKLHQSTR